MGMPAINTQNTSNNLVAIKPVQKDRYVLGNSDTAFEGADHAVATSNVTLERVRSLFTNKNMFLAETKGDPLKVMLKIEKSKDAPEQIKLCGIVKALGGKRRLDESDIPRILKEIKEGVIAKAISNEAFVDLW